MISCNIRPGLQGCALVDAPRAARVTLEQALQNISSSTDPPRIKVNKEPDFPYPAELARSGSPPHRKSQWHIPIRTTCPEKHHHCPRQQTTTTQRSRNPFADFLLIRHLQRLCQPRLSRLLLPGILVRNEAARAHPRMADYPLEAPSIAPLAP